MADHAARHPIPAFVNPAAGSAADAIALLEADDRFLVRPTDPSQLAPAIAEAAAGGDRRVVVAGGDGTIASAAAVAHRHRLELAILPGGTLNHFAARLGITAGREALDVAAGAHTRLLDVGYLNERMFLNTSSVGAYVSYVRMRQRTQRLLGYHVSSALAALRLLFRLRSMHVRLEVEGESVTLPTPLVFAGVGERRLATPRFGELLRGGARSLHVIVVDGSEPARRLVFAMAAAAGGRDTVHRTPSVIGNLADSFVVELPLPLVRVSLDGELHRMRTPLRYRIERDALCVVVPPPVERRDGN